jgi:hypothetical protein
MDRRDLGRCHQCGNLLGVHGHFVAEGHQHEEYYCSACGGIERRVIRLRLNDAPWRKVYERRQKLIAQGPASGGLLKRHRSNAKATRRWIEEIFRLGQRLVGDDAPGLPVEQPPSDLGTQRGPALERRP